MYSGVSTMMAMAALALAGGRPNAMYRASNGLHRAMHGTCSRATLRLSGDVSAADGQELRSVVYSCLPQAIALGERAMDGWHMTASPAPAQAPEVARTRKLARAASPRMRRCTAATARCRRRCSAPLASLFSEEWMSREQRTAR